VEQRSLFLLVAAGMIERRTRFRISLLNRTNGLEAVISATGEYGAVEAIEKLLPRLWDKWRKAWHEWESGCPIGSSPFRWEQLAPDRWRLTDQGVFAAGDLETGKTDVVLDFVFQQNFFRGRSAVRGRGELHSLNDFSGNAIPDTTVHVGNWDEGAEAFCSHLTQLLSAAMVRPNQRSAETEQGPSNGEPVTTRPVTKPAESDVPHTLQRFTGGTMVFFRERVELCGVVICSESMSTKKWRVLGLLRDIQSEKGRGYSGAKLAAELELADARSAAGLIRDIRKQIKTALMEEANIDCRNDDVIVSGGAGYRLSQKLSIQGAGKNDETPLQDHEIPQDVQSDPVDATVNDPVGDPVLPSDDTVATRHIRILQAIQSGRKLRAPHIADELDSPLPTIKRDWKTLKNEGKIEFIGSPKTGHYRLRLAPELAD